MIPYHQTEHSITVVQAQAQTMTKATTEERRNQEKMYYSDQPDFNIFFIFLPIFGDHFKFNFLMQEFLTVLKMQ